MASHDFLGEVERELGIEPPRQAVRAAKPKANGAAQHLDVVPPDDVPPAESIDDFGAFGPEQAPRPAPAVKPLALSDPTGWDDRPVPPRRWLVPQRIPAGNVTLLYGDGGAGKTTIALQLVVATAITKAADWLGAVIDCAGPVIFFSAEEDEDEVHRRLDAILAHRNLRYSELEGRLHLHCIPGDDAVLGLPDKSDVIRPTQLFHQLEAAVNRISPALIVIEAAADVFAGNEIDRAQVRQFIGLLRRLTLGGNGPAVLLLAHPSQSGLNSGSGTSGSTAWSNSVRSRLYFTTPKLAPNSDEPLESELRQLQVMKANYGPAGEVVKLRWQKGVFVPASVNALEQMAADAKVDSLFMMLLAERNAQRRHVTDSKATGYAPAEFAKMDGAQGCGRRAFEAAMERLFAAGRIRVAHYGPASKPRKMIVAAPPSNSPSN